ncbi:hypothetical protein Taro_022410, partial [Colocasia esculenta]|nr:hypothetical protein [Colocasia esculenta]
MLMVLARETVVNLEEVVASGTTKEICWLPSLISRALCDGIRLANFLGLTIASIKSDSSVLAFYWWREAYIMFQKDNIHIYHVYREENQMEDILANFGCLSKENNVYRGSSNIPYSCKGPMVLDKTSFFH